MNTKINYLYRDASNYKVHNECVIFGPITDEQKTAILAACVEGEYFVPSVVGMPEKRFNDYCDDDHCFFELNACDFEDVQQEPTLDINAAILVSRFEEAARYGKWEAAAKAFARAHFPDEGPIVTAEKYAKLRQYLIDNGVAADKADTVAQAVCYIVTGEETEQFMDV